VGDEQDRAFQVSLLACPRLAAAGAVGIAVAVIAVAAVKAPRVTSAPVQGFAFKRGAADLQPGGNKKALFGASEFRWADYAGRRGLPETGVPGQRGAVGSDPCRESGWESMNRKAHSTANGN
jgi:hypothetical protein